MPAQKDFGALRAMRMTYAELLDAVRFYTEGRWETGDDDANDFTFYIHFSESAPPPHLAFLSSLAGNTPCFVRLRYHPWAWRIHAERLPGNPWQYMANKMECLEGDFVGVRYDRKFGWTGAILRLAGDREVFVPGPCVHLVGLKYKDLLDEREEGEPAFES